MKKAISVILALSLLFALCVPAFAADDPTCIKYDADGDPQFDPEQAEGKQTADTFVKTSDKDINGNDPVEYSVCFPAEIVIAWNDTTAHDVSYTVTSHIHINDSLKVKVERLNDGVMSPNTTGNPGTLTFDLTVPDGGAEETIGFAENAKKHEGYSVSIADFSKAPIDEYTGQLKYTVTYTDGHTSPPATPTP